jgi:hypothetical protein
MSGQGRYHDLEQETALAVAVMVPGTVEIFKKKNQQKG